MQEGKPKSRKDLTFDEIASALAQCAAGSMRQNELLAELTRRQALAQVESAESQKSSSKWFATAAIASALSAIFSLASLFVHSGCKPH